MRNINYLTDKLVTVLPVLSILIILNGCTDEIQTVTKFQNLVMSDEFDTDGMPNDTLWSFYTGIGQDKWGNNELQYYTDRPENVQVKNGMLLITARQEDFQGADYTSAGLLTKGKFEQTYGRFEARMQLPYGQGMAPAFLLLGADVDSIARPVVGEIDIMEYRGQNPTIMLGRAYGPFEPVSKEYELENDRFDTGFHVFGIEWGPGYINYYVDDVLYNQITPQQVRGSWVFDKPFFIQINMAVGGNLIGSPNAETVFPQTMLVDYVRVYQ